MVSACFWALLPRTSGVVRSAMHGAYSLSWSRSFQDVDSSRAANLGLCSTRISCQCYSSEWPIGHKDTGTQAMLKDEKDAFFVVRKGDIIGVYKSLSDCQAQVGSSVRDPPVSVYKGHAMPKGVEKYLLSCGLKGALYSFKADDLTERLFGTLLPCHSYQLPSSCRDEISIKLGPKKWPQEVLSSLSGHSCTLEFDGSSKGNPGQSGAGVVLRAADGSWICRLREGLGIETAYASQYQAIILGLQYALDKGFRSIHVQGDSDLVCMQVCHTHGHMLWIRFFPIHSAIIHLVLTCLALFLLNFSISYDFVSFLPFSMWSIFCCIVVQKSGLKFHSTNGSKQRTLNW
nr:uncharacterized protein LOC113716921 isoform X2 [Coffea arabica]